MPRRRADLTPEVSGYYIWVPYRERYGVYAQLVVAGRIEDYLEGSTVKEKGAKKLLARYKKKLSQKNG